MVKIKAFERWPIEDGWYGHSAAIEPVTLKFFEMLINANHANALNLERIEEPASYHFDDGTADPFGVRTEQWPESLHEE